MRLNCSILHSDSEFSSSSFSSSSNVTLSLLPSTVEEILRSLSAEIGQLRTELEESRKLNTSFACTLTESQRELETLRSIIEIQASDLVTAREELKLRDCTSVSVSSSPNPQSNSESVVALGTEQCQTLNGNGNGKGKNISPRSAEGNLETNEKVREEHSLSFEEGDPGIQTRPGGPLSARTSKPEEETTKFDRSSSVDENTQPELVKDSSLKPESSAIDQPPEDDSIHRLELFISNIREERDFLLSSNQTLAAEVRKLREERDKLKRAERRVSSQYLEMQSKHRSLEQEYQDVGACMERLLNLSMAVE